MTLDAPQKEPSEPTSESIQQETIVENNAYEWAKDAIRSAFDHAD